MKIEQYFLMTDYALWQVILNSDSPPPTRSFNGVEKAYPPTTVEEKLVWKNELKARGVEAVRSPRKYRRHFSNSSMRTLMELAQKDLIRSMIEYPTKNPSSAFPSNLPRFSIPVMKALRIPLVSSLSPLLAQSSGCLPVHVVLMLRGHAFSSKMTSSVAIIAFHLILVKANGLCPFNT
nr:hypothetical protein [Tanacetum cinerariifolium]